LKAIKRNATVIENRIKTQQKSENKLVKDERSITIFKNQAIPFITLL